MRKKLAAFLIIALISISNISLAQEASYADIASATKSSKDPTFASMLKDSVAFKKAMGKDSYYSRMHKLIFRGDIEPMFAEAKTWEEIDKALQTKYGPLGEEAYLLTRSDICMQAKQWAEYLPLGKRLLEKYGSHLSVADRKRHEDAIKLNQK